MRPKSAPREQVKCTVCGITFTARISKHRVVCSPECQAIATARRYQARRILKKCTFCGKEFEVPTHRRDATYCSFICKQTFVAQSTVVERAAKLRGRGKGKSYTKFMGRHLHRIVAEEKMGRSLRPGEVVHHLNGDKFDNRPENLAITTQQIHASVHSRKNRICGVPGCGRKHAAKGYCQYHYDKIIRNR